jgi:LmbE family N-acetylglucosaminyl deacetylase
MRNTLLAVFAHPDDESFGPGGTLAKYAREGVEVWLVCGTDGAAGSIEAGLLAGYAGPGQVRAAELCCAALELGLAGIDWFGYRDSGMAGAPDNQHPDCLVQAPLDQVTGQIVASIRRHRPQVVICDNEFGGYGHPDHIKLHQATVAAFAASADPDRYPESGPPHQVQRLYFTAFNPGVLKAVVRLMPLLGRDPHKFGRNGDIDLTKIVSWETPVHARIDVRQYYDVKQRASACHRSQGGPAEAFRWLPDFAVRRMFGFETFQQQAPPPLPGAALRRELFG